MVHNVSRTEYPPRGIFTFLAGSFSWSLACEVLKRDWVPELRWCYWVIQFADRLGIVFCIIHLNGMEREHCDFCQHRSEGVWNLSDTWYIQCT